MGSWKIPAINCGEREPRPKDGAKQERAPARGMLFFTGSRIECGTRFLVGGSPTNSTCKACESKSRSSSRNFMLSIFSTIACSSSADIHRPHRPRCLFQSMRCCASIALSRIFSNNYDPKGTVFGLGPSYKKCRVLWQFLLWPEHNHCS